MTIYLYIMLLFTVGYVALDRQAARPLRRQLGWLPWALVAFVYVAAALSPRPEPFLVACGLVPLIRPRSRADVACRYALLMPMMPELTVTLHAGSHVLAQLTPYTSLSFGSLLASAIARDPGPPPAPFRLRPEHAVIALFIVIYGIASPRFDDLSALIRGLLNYIMLLVIPFWLLVRTIRTREELFLVIGCFGASTVLLSVLALYEHHAGWSLFDALTDRINIDRYLARSASIRGGALRPSVTMGTPIEFGMLLALGLFATAATLPLYRRRRVGLVAMAIISLALLSAQSRGALLMVGLGILVVLIAQRRWGLAGGVAALGGLAYGMLKLASTSSTRVAAFMGAGQNYGSFRDYRTLLLARGLEEGRKHPWIGASLDQVTTELSDLTQGEHIVDFVNTYLHVYLMSGLLGLGLLVAALAVVGFELIRVDWKALRQRAERPRLFCLAGLAGYLLSLATSSFYGRVPFMLVFLLVVARVLRATDTSPRRRSAMPVLMEVRQQAAARAAA